MSVPTASLVLSLLYGYAICGIVFASWFVVRGVARLDPVAASGTAGFRILLVPGSAVLWPVLLAKVIARRRRTRDPHFQRVERP